MATLESVYGFYQVAQALNVVILQGEYPPSQGEAAKETAGAEACARRVLSQREQVGLPLLPEVGPESAQA